MVYRETQIHEGPHDTGSLFETNIHPSLLTLDAMVTGVNLDANLKPDAIIDYLRQIPVWDYKPKDFKELTRIAFQIHDGRKLSILRRAMGRLADKLDPDSPSANDIETVAIIYRNLSSMTIGVHPSIVKWLTHHVRGSEATALAPVQILKGFSEFLNTTRYPVEGVSPDITLLEACCDKLRAIGQLKPIDSARTIAALALLIECGFIKDVGSTLLKQVLRSISAEDILSDFSIKDCELSLTGLSRLKELEYDDSLNQLVAALFARIENDVTGLTSSQLARIVTAIHETTEGGRIPIPTDLLLNIEYKLVGSIEKHENAFYVHHSQAIIRALYGYVLLGLGGQALAEAAAGRVYDFKPRSASYYARLAFSLSHFDRDYEAYIVCAAADQLSLNEFLGDGDRAAKIMNRVAAAIGYEFDKDKSTYLSSRMVKTREELLSNRSSFEIEVELLLQKMQIQYESEKLVGAFCFDFEIPYGDSKVLLEVGHLNYHFRRGQRELGRKPEDLLKRKFCTRHSLHLTEIFSDTWQGLSARQKEHLILESLRLAAGS